MSDKPSTYFGRAITDPDAPGGRYAKSAAAIVSADPLPLAVPQWSRDLAAMPPEPPLGIRVDDVPDLGFPYEARIHAAQRTERGTADVEK